MMPGFRGAAPTVTTGLTEKAKYQKLWRDVPEYRHQSFGERSFELFEKHVKPSKGASFIDLGCGTGRAGIKAHAAGLSVTLADFAPDCLDEAAKVLPFVEQDLTRPLKVNAKYGYCSDVMEHIPTDDVDKVIRNITEACQHCFFQICTVPDAFGEKIGEKLHLTVERYSWWLKKFADHDCQILWSADNGSWCVFYVTAWRDAGKLPEGFVNTNPEVVKEHIRANGKHGIQPVVPHEKQETEVLIACGGPSLNDYEEEITRLRGEGMPLVTMNGTYNWSIDRGLKPSMQMVIDARPHNKRFLEPLVDTCKYFLASQCHPSLFEGLPKERTFMWQVSLSDALMPVIEESFGPMGKEWIPCGGGSTVMLRGLVLLRMLGFYKFHIYGFDSCLVDEKHHAYEQKENEHRSYVCVSVGDRIFRCQPWMAYQAQEFVQMVRVLGDEMLCEIKGDGLVATMLQTGAEMEKAA